MAIAIGIAALLLLLSIVGYYIGWIIFIGVVLLCLVISLAVHLKRGPTCACHLKMPFAVHELPSLCRQKYARRVLERLTPLVQKFQGSLSVDEIKSRIHERVSVPSPVHLPQAGIVEMRGQAEEYSCFVHKIMFGLLLLDAAFTSLEFFSSHLVVEALNKIGGLSVIIFVIAALVKQNRRSLPRMVKGLVWTVLAVLCASNLLVFVYVVSILSTRKDNLHNADRIVESIFRNPGENPVVAKFFICYIVTGTVLGLWGLAAIMIHRSRTGKLIPVSADNAVPSLVEQVES